MLSLSVGTVTEFHHLVRVLEVKMKHVRLGDRPLTSFGDMWRNVSTMYMYNIIHHTGLVIWFMILLNYHTNLFCMPWQHVTHSQELMEYSLELHLT